MYKDMHQKKKRANVAVILATCLFLLNVAGLGLSEAKAHGLYVFAWVEGDKICAEGYYSSNRKMRNGTTQAFSPEGELLAEGLSDESGNWCFPIPKVAEITVVYMDGQGHRAEFVLPLSDVPAPAQESMSTPNVDKPEAETNPAQLSQPASVDHANSQSDLRMDDVRQIIREEVSMQIAPLQHMLEERGKLSLREAVGFAGYFFGLLGMGLWAFGRRK